MFGTIQKLFCPTRTKARPRQVRLGLETLHARDVPATFWVTNDDDSGPGSLRAALEEAATGPYIDIPNEIVIDDTVTLIELESQLYSPNSSILVIRPETADHLVQIQPTWDNFHDFRFLTLGVANQGHYELHNLYVRLFGATDSGGAIVYRGAELLVRNCLFELNQSGGNGGVIAATGLELTVEYSTFGYENHADGHGGAIFFMPNGGTHPLTIVDSEFAQNTAGGHGGAIYTRTTGLSSMTGSEEYALVFMMNVAGGLGGAVYHELGSLYISFPPRDETGTAPMMDNFSESEGGGAVHSYAAASVVIDADMRNNFPVDLYIVAASIISVNWDRIDSWVVI